MSDASLTDAAWKALAVRIKDRDGWQCVGCGSRDDLTVDHRISIYDIDTLGYDPALKRDPDNLLTLCRSCNAKKGRRSDRRVTWTNPRWLPHGPVFSQ